MDFSTSVCGVMGPLPTLTTSQPGAKTLDQIFGSCQCSHSGGVNLEELN
jgi:hypothetical protein